MACIWLTKLIVNEVRKESAASDDFLDWVSE